MMKLETKIERPIPTSNTTGLVPNWLSINRPINAKITIGIAIEKPTSSAIGAVLNCGLSCFLFVSTSIHKRNSLAKKN